MKASIQEHNQRAAAVWSSGADGYNDVSAQIATALDHCVRRVAPQPGEHILDLATGTGWTSRLLARAGAHVTGADFAADMLAAARARAAAEHLDITYEIGDAEKLPFSDASFDAVVSTCGVMFASHPEAAAAEMARVCRPGGRLGLVTWHPQGNVYRMFMVMRPYMPPPPTPAPPSPFAWGNRQRVEELLGAHFDLKFEEGTAVYYERDAETAWRVFSAGYGPTKTLVGSLDDARREQLHRDFVAMHEEFKTPLGIALPREYLLVIGRRR